MIIIIIIIIVIVNHALGPRAPHHAPAQLK